ncbi:signal peptide peptidase SppA [Phosphitispora sp. TUW77]|uniref:signal peptide peptidase SppA n=1 Tax=Phosphitispora sp. TUW77 TaxID=3152361 RepID=UPI003AB50461
MGVFNINKKIVVGLIAGIILLSLVAAIVSGPESKDKVSGGEVIGVIYVEGVISGSRGEGSVFSTGMASGHSIMEQLREAGEDNGVKAVLLRINSPGGSAAASQEIGNELDKLRKQGKIVVASMGDVAASGGYWLAAKADKIVADPATLTGSIGVIMETQSLQELFDKIGITPETIKSGAHKDMGSVNRPLTPEERDILQHMVDDIYQQFVDVVAEGRKMEREKVLELADGRIFTGRQAKEKGLVDELGNYYDAIKITGELAGIKGEPVIREFGYQSPFEKFLSVVSIPTAPNSEFLGLSPSEIEALKGLLKIQSYFSEAF